MAKYRIVNKREGDRYVNCRVLNESAGDYIVQFDDKSIKSVPAGSVSSLNRIDEGVLDKVKEFGNKILSGFKKIGKWLRFSAGDEVIPTGIPANAYVDLTSTPGVAFSGSTVTNDIAFSNGIATREINNIDEEYDDGLGDDVKYYLYSMLNNYVVSMGGEPVENGYVTTKTFGQNESKRSPYRRINDVNEEIDIFNDPNLRKLNFLGGKQLISTDDEKEARYNRVDAYSTNKINTKKLKAIVDDSIHTFMKYGVPKGLKIYPCIWGAPGIGKTDIITTVYEQYKRKYPQLNFHYLNLATAKIYDICMPDIEVDSSTGGRKNISVYKSWLPIASYAETFNDLPATYQKGYDDSIKNGVISREELVKNYNKMTNEIANGGWAELNADGEFIQIRKGYGGVIFFDEISRVDPKVLNVLMTIMSERKVEGGVIGDKWCFIFAGNRRIDMVSTSNTGFRGSRNEKFEVDPAIASRILHYDFIPSVDEWCDFVVKKYKIPEEIMVFFRTYDKILLQNAKSEGLDTFKEMDPNENNGIKIANPRNWLGAILALMRHIEGGNKLVDDEKTIASLFKGSNITLEEYVDEVPYEDDDQERVDKGIAYVAEKLKGTGLEAADLVHFFDNKEVRAFAKYNDITEIPIEDISELIYNQVGAVGAVNFGYYIKSLKEFSFNHAKGLIHAHPCINNEIKTGQDYITRDDIANIKYDGLISKRIARYIGKAMEEEFGDNRGYKYINSDEFYNILAYTIILGRQSGNCTLAVNLFNEDIYGQLVKNEIFASGGYDEDLEKAVKQTIQFFCMTDDGKNVSDKDLYANKCKKIKSQLKGEYDNVIANKK